MSSLGIKLGGEYEHAVELQPRDFGGKLREGAETADLRFERRVGTPLGYFARFTAV